MRLLSRLKFRTKLNLGISALLILMALLLLPMVGVMTSRTLVEESKKRGVALSESLSSRAVDPLLALDFLRLKNMVDEQVVVGDVVYAFVQDNQDHVLAHTYSGGFPSDLIGANGVQEDDVSIRLLADGPRRIYDFATPVRIDGARLGTVRVGLSRERITASVTQQLTTMASLFAAALMVATALGTLFARQIASRLALLKDHAEALLRGDLEFESAPSEYAHCWERQDCGMESCPAYGERRRCWNVVGTLCPECDRTAGVSHDSCRQRRVYQESAGDEIQELAETFDVMALSLKTHIDELRSAERSLRDQQRLMRTILDVTPDRVSLVDTKLRYQGGNRSFAESVGLNLDEIKGATDFDLFDERTAEERHLAARDILESGKRLDTQVMVAEGDEARWYYVVCIPVLDEEGAVTGLLRTDRDITDLKGYEQQLIQAQKMESLGLLAGGVAHEINTPLGIILGYAQLLQEDAEPGGQLREDLGVVEKQAQVCKKIVADLLGFSRQSQSAKREMCFNNSIMEAVTLVRHTFELDRVRIVTQMDDRFPIIYGDPEKLKQVWINLLTNARDAMSGTGGVILIRTRLDTPAGIVSVWAADTGEGIAPDALKKIFDPFYSTKPVGVGTGLGLSVSFGIIEEHGGRILASSPVPDDFMPQREPDDPERGPGTLFEVDLPLDHSEDETADETAARRAATAHKE